MRHRFGAMLILCLAISFLPSCGAEQHEQTVGNIKINRGLVGEPNTLDPQRNSTVQGNRVLIDLFEGLLRYSPLGEIENGMAESWSVSDDGLLYSFTLRKDGKWSNGDAVTAHDFEYSFKRLVAPETAAFYAGFVSSIVNAPDILVGEKNKGALGVVAKSDYELEIELSEPTAYFPQLLTHPATFPLHRSSVEEHGERYTRPGNFVTNGAYKLVSYVSGSEIQLERNLQYRENDQVKIDVVHYHVVVSDDAMYKRYRAGELHVTGSVPSSLFKKIAEERGEELKVAPQLGVYYYAFNMTRPPFAGNKGLREALSIVIDREVLVENITGRGELPAYGWVPPGIDGYSPAKFRYAKMSRHERIQAGKRLYAEAGFSAEKPAQFELRYNMGEVEDRMAVAAQSMWREALGAEVTLVNEEFKVLISNIRQMHVTEMYRLSWIGDYFDPQTFLQLLESDNPSNLSGYSNDQFDRLMRRAAQEIEPEKRMSILQEAEQLALDDHPVIPLYFYVSKHLVRPEVKGWNETLIDYHPTRHLSIDVSTRQ